MNLELLIIEEDRKRCIAWQLWYESGLTCFEFFNVQIDEDSKSCWKQTRYASPGQ